MFVQQIIICAAIIAFLVVGFLARRKVISITDFTLSKGNLGWFSIAAGISMTFAGGAAILNTASLAYTFKWYTLIDPFSLLIGVIIVIILYRTFQNEQGITISSLLSSNDRKLNILIGIITSTVFILIVAAQFVALSKLVSPYFPMVNPLFITFILSTLIFSYVFLGGFSSVTKTDIVQLLAIFMFLIIPIVFFIISGNYSAVVSKTNHNFVDMPLDYIILFSIPILFIPLSQDINIRIKSARNAVQGKKGLIVGALLYLTIVVASSLIGIYLATNNVGLDDPEMAYSIFFQNHFPYFGAFGIIAALAAIISSTDSYVLNAITSLSNDIFRPLEIFEKKSSDTLIKFSAVITYIISLIIALFFNEILVLVLSSLLLYISVLLPIALAKKVFICNNYIFISSLVLTITIALIEILNISIPNKPITYPVIGILMMILLGGFEKLTYIIKGGKGA